MAVLQGSDWSEKEVDACVDAYFQHLALEFAGRPFVKAQIYRTLAAQTGRTPSSIEFKFQNISAVLNVMGREWMTGLAPLANYQELLAQKVASHIHRIDSIPIFKVAPVGQSQLNDAAAFFLEAPPLLKTVTENLPDYIAKLIRKFDPVGRDMKNRELGEAGERFVLNHEKRFLSLIGRSDLADSVRWVAKEDGDGAGYDILSFTDRGDQKFVEVKTTVGSNRTPFFMSRNEFSFSQSNVDKYNLVRLYNFRRNVHGFELTGNIRDHVRLTTESYRAEF